jgi:hypothetical protein
MNSQSSNEIDKILTEDQDTEEDYSDSDNSQEDDSSEDEQEVSNEPVKKKRGRKCKPKDENQPIEKIQKKRGRKPKQKDPDEIEKVPKKRGRKPKEKVYSVKELPKTFFEENKNEALILHLPIKASDKLDDNPLPDNKNNIEYSIFDENMNNYNINNSSLLPTQQNFLEENFKDNNNFMFDNEKYEVNINVKKEEVEDDVKHNRIVKKSLKNIMYEFINANNDKTWPESTNTHCWWCCHQFDGIPCALPEYYKKDKFYVNGCFCSFNCTASYNFSKNDDDIWERYSLLNLMYKKLYNKYSKINLAPPREILKMFGGYMSIEEFRENSLKNEKTFVLIKPPLISIISKIEENISTNKNIKNNFPVVNENILNKTQNNLKLKRNKPVTNPNSTLQSFMDLKII